MGNRASSPRVRECWKKEVMNVAQTLDAAKYDRDEATDEDDFVLVPTSEELSRQSVRRRTWGLRIEAYHDRTSESGHLLGQRVKQLTHAVICVSVLSIIVMILASMTSRSTIESLGDRMHKAYRNFDLLQGNAFFEAFLNALTPIIPGAAPVYVRSVAEQTTTWCPAGATITYASGTTVLTAATMMTLPVVSTTATARVSSGSASWVSSVPTAGSYESAPVSSAMALSTSSAVTGAVALSIPVLSSVSPEETSSMPVAVSSNSVSVPSVAIATPIVPGAAYGYSAPVSSATGGVGYAQPSGVAGGSGNAQPSGIASATRSSSGIDPCENLPAKGARVLLHRARNNALKLRTKILSYGRCRSCRPCGNT
ncbi:hypothetical protein D6C99_09157 [Aureobasidium pullulans]|nr:hypothetical protein D6D29_10320 [Aureobasidium pullulans]THV88817.1 hypothetical protein D6D27_06979 [Aureobasidium pullulans]THY38310.1 hypothetical protein D6C99_09157 [Aureobasidium pullulans]